MHTHMAVLLRVHAQVYSRTKWKNDEEMRDTKRKIISLRFLFCYYLFVTIRNYNKNRYRLIVNVSPTFVDSQIFNRPLIRQVDTKKLWSIHFNKSKSKKIHGINKSNFLNSIKNIDQAYCTKIINKYLTK